MAVLSAGDCFPSFNDLMTRIGALEAEKNSKFFKSSSVTLRNFLEKSPGHYISKAVGLKADKDAFVDEIKYRLIKFACTHGGRKYVGKADRTRNTKTKKLDCPVLITVMLDKSMQLVVKEANLEHSHAVSKATFMLQPENRRLTEDEKNEVRQFHRVGADKKRIRQHVLDRYGKTVTRHDLNNVLRVPKGSESDLETAIRVLSERGFTSTVVEDGDTVCGLFFQDAEMRSAYEKFPELLLMDSTYKLVDIRTPVFTILTVDSFGRGVPLAVFLVTNETAHMISAMLRVFREHNTSAANRTKVWLTDKDRAEKAAIREVFPTCDQFLCSFHVLQSFRRELNLTGIDKAERERILRVLQELVFATSDTEYSRLREDIRHAATDRYLRENWDGIRHEWVRGLSGAAMSGVFTNNHLESLHGKLKSVCRNNDTLPNFILSYLVVLTTVRADRNAEIYSETGKRPTSCRFSELQEYQCHVTAFALSLLQEELLQSATVTLTISPAGQQTACDRTGVVAVSPTDCSCLFRRHYDLPCRHILAVRQDRQLCLFSQELVAQRWLLSFAADHLEAQVACRVPTNPSVSTCRLPPADPPRTERQRFRQLHDITTRIASVGSELTGQEHSELAEKLTMMLDLLQKGRRFLVVEEVQGDAHYDHRGIDEFPEQPTGEGDDRRNSSLAVSEQQSHLNQSGSIPEPTGPVAGSSHTATEPEAPATPPRDRERPCFDLWSNFFNSSPQPEQKLVPATPQRSPVPLAGLAHQPLVPSPLTKTRTPDFSGRMCPRQAVVSPSRPGGSGGTPSHHVSAVPRRLVIPSPSTRTPRSEAFQTREASGPVTSARRNLWSPSRRPNAAVLSASRSSQPSPLTDDSDPVVIDFLSPTIGPSPVIGGLFPRARAVAVGAPVAGPSSSGAHRLTCRDGSDSSLQQLAMPPRVQKNRGRPKGSKTTVVGSTRK